MKIVFTGGGSGGHVIPNIAIIDELKKKYKEKLSIIYVGSESGIERELIEKLNIDYRPIKTGKFRRYRYLSKENIKDIFNVFKGIKMAKDIIKNEKPDLVFSKGGFVSVPVVIGAWHNKVPVIIHESDMTPGLANKISMPFAKKICVTFPETISMVSKKKVVLTGSPVRESILNGSRKKAKEFFGFEDDKKIILVVGGSLGAKALNKAIFDAKGELLANYNVVMICGKGKVDESQKEKGLALYEYLDKELSDAFSAADIIISRAGAGSIFEILKMAIPNILVPLSKKASRGDQILNAHSFQKQGFSKVIEDENLNSESLYREIKDLDENRDEYISKMKNTTLKDANCEIVKLIESEFKNI